MRSKRLFRIYRNWTAHSHWRSTDYIAGIKHALALFYGNCIRIAPCLNIGADDVDKSLDIMDDALAAIG